MGAARDLRAQKRQAELASRLVLRSLTVEELDALLEDAEPATEDDVPWRFPVRTPLQSPPD